MKDKLKNWREREGERKEKVTEQTNSILAICLLYLMI